VRAGVRNRCARREGEKNFKMPPKKQRKTAPRRVRTITEEELPQEIDQTPDDELLELETFFNEIGTGDDVRGREII